MVPPKKSSVKEKPKSSKLPKHERVQTAEGWKRMMEKQKSEKKKKTKKTK